jgi:phosphatidylserine/phosphatidylglycerophosphate/cardiolipin synthase-like enzyme
MGWPFPFGDGFPGLPPIGGFDPFSPIPPIPPIPPIEAPKPMPPIKPTARSAALPFFLPPHNNTDDMVFRGSIRQALNVTPIIDGKEIFAALETAITQAEASVLIAFWSLDPQMKMVTDSTKSWADLLMDAAGRGVMVRVLLNDFDPGLQLAQHVNAWKAYLLLQKAADSVPIDKFQIVCSRHEAETADTIMEKVRPGLYDAVAAEINKVADPATRTTVFGFAPGLWNKLNLLADKTVEPKVKGKNYPGWPAVHHQKLVIVDSKYTFTGGLNVTAQYLDTPKHEKPELPWHDAFVKVEGSFVLRDLIRNYVGLWNQERVRADAFLKSATSGLKLKTPPKFRQTTDLTASAVPVKLTSTVAPKISSQVHRTISKKGTDPTGIPVTIRQDVLEGYVQAIAQAEEFIYLENQYFREQTIANAIIQRHKEKPDLRTIIVLPKIIEEFLNSAGDELSKHGAAVQFELLRSMKTTIGANLGLFAMVRKDNKLIYVHSKLCIVDDAFASIGSANCNPRSFRVDTELDLTWHEAAVTKQLRLDLWKEILGSPSTLKSWKPKQFVTKWTEIAKKNIRSARTQKGFVIPFENTNEGSKHFLNLSPFV